jgi:hypothetical protein
MRMDEITINIPITIDLDGAKPRVSVAGKPATDDEDLDQNPVMISPQQQELELKKAEQGKQSPSIEKMLDDDAEGDEEDALDQNDNINNLKTLAGLTR